MYYDATVLSSEDDTQIQLVILGITIIMPHITSERISHRPLDGYFPNEQSLIRCPFAFV